jgi:recombinational DNA repair protein (RecF pathway)
MLERGSCVSATWQCRTGDGLGHYTLEPEKGLPAGVLEDPLKLGAMLSACALCDEALPEREGHPGLFHGLQTLIGALESDHWGPIYVMWEIAFLKELGFGLDLVRCAMGGDPAALSHRPVVRSDILSERYLAYALSTIMSRSLPDVRDGLKPVHRRDPLCDVRQLAAGSRLRLQEVGPRGRRRHG